MAAPRFSVVRHPGRGTVRHAWWALALVALVALVAPALSSCGSGPGSGSPSSSPDASLKTADAAVQSAMTRYEATVNGCKTAPSPVVCVETADRTLGGQIHTYANLLAVGHGFTVTAADLNAARNTAQTLANSLEILGDAQPTQANYDQVLNTFNVNAAIAQLQGAVDKVNGRLAG